MFYRKSGLAALPVALFNGVPFSSEEMDPDELETIILQRIMETTNFFQRSVFMVNYLDLEICKLGLSQCRQNVCILSCTGSDH